MTLKELLLVGLVVLFTIAANLMLRGGLVRASFMTEGAGDRSHPGWHCAGGARIRRIR